MIFFQRTGQKPASPGGRIGDTSGQQISRQAVATAFL
jgi:hypothetical protein